MQLKGFWHSNSVWLDFPHFAHIDGIVHLSLGCPYLWHFWHLSFYFCIYVTYSNAGWSCGFIKCWYICVCVYGSYFFAYGDPLTSVMPCGLNCSLISTREHNVRSGDFITPFMKFRVGWGYVFMFSFPNCFNFSIFSDCFGFAVCIMMVLFIAFLILIGSQCF